MKHSICLLLLLICLGSCKKTIEEAQEDAVVDAITTGYWLVTKYTKGATDITDNFKEYKFQFKENSTVDAYKNNTIEKTGQWQADAVSRSITASFSNATVPLLLLNGTWTIKNTTWASVDASQTINGENCLLRLDKQ